MQLNWTKIVNLSRENISTYTSKTAGVYVIWVMLKNNTWKCYYVGQASDIQQRLLDHISPIESNKCIKEISSQYICGFCIASVTTQGDRDGIERFLYESFKPQCNDIAPPGSKSIPVNFPS